MSLYFHSIFSQASLFGAHRHIAAPTGFATFHASTCEVKSPNIRPSHDITAIIVYNKAKKAYTILRHNSSFCPVYRHIVLYDGARGRPGRARMHARAPRARAPHGVLIHGRLVNFGDSHALWRVVGTGMQQGRRAGAPWTQTGRWHSQNTESFDSRHRYGLFRLLTLCSLPCAPGATVIRHVGVRSALAMRLTPRFLCGTLSRRA